MDRGTADGTPSNSGKQGLARQRQGHQSASPLRTGRIHQSIAPAGSSRWHLPDGPAPIGLGFGFGFGRRLGGMYAPELFPVGMPAKQDQVAAFSAKRSPISRSRVA